MVKIDIEKLTEEELIELNRKIVARLQLLKRKQRQERMLGFNIGDRVSFQYKGRPKIGIITKYNQKTVTVITEEEEEEWNISPSLLQKAKCPKSKQGL